MPASLSATVWVWVVSSVSSVMAAVLLSLQIKQARRATREEKKRKAMAMREKELGALGLQVSCGLPIHTHSYMQVYISRTGPHINLPKNIQYEHTCTHHTL